MKEIATFSCQVYSSSTQQSEKVRFQVLKPISSDFYRADPNIPSEILIQIAKGNFISQRNIHHNTREIATFSCQVYFSSGMVEKT